MRDIFLHDFRESHNARFVDIISRQIQIDNPFIQQQSFQFLLITLTNPIVLQDNRGQTPHITNRFHEFSEPSLAKLLRNGEKPDNFLEKREKINTLLTKFDRFIVSIICKGFEGLKLVICTLFLPTLIAKSRLLLEFFFEVSGNFEGKPKFAKACRKVSAFSLFSMEYSAFFEAFGSMIGAWLGEISGFYAKFISYKKKLWGFSGNTQEILPGLRQCHGITRVLQVLLLQIADNLVLLLDFVQEIRVLLRHSLVFAGVFISFLEK